MEPKPGKIKGGSEMAGGRGGGSGWGGQGGIWIFLSEKERSECNVKMGETAWDITQTSRPRIGIIAVPSTPSMSGLSWLGVEVMANCTTAPEHTHITQPNTTCRCVTPLDSVLCYATNQTQHAGVLRLWTPFCVTPLNSVLCNASELRFVFGWDVRVYITEA
jgi:hypothetical protein